MLTIVDETIKTHTTGRESAGPNGERSCEVAMILLVSRSKFIILCTYHISHGLKEADSILRSIRGFGDYAVTHHLIMVGYYDKIPIDTVVVWYLKKRLWCSETPILH